MTSDGPRLGGGRQFQPKESDRLNLQFGKSRRRPTDIESRLLHAVTRLHIADDRAQAEYSEALNELRERPDEVRKAVEALERSSPDDHQLHWSLYYVVSGLERSEFVPTLVEAAVRDLPVITEDTPCESGDEEKILVAVMAAEGLEQLARNEPDAAIGALMEVVERQPNVAVRTAAIQAILSVRPDAVKDIARLLPDDQRHLLELRRTNVEQLSVTPERATPGRLAQRSPKLPADRGTPQERTE